MNNYRKATSYLCDWLEDRILDGEFRTPKYTFADALADDFPGVDWQTGVEFGSRYVVADPVASMFTQLAREDYRFYDLCVEICVCNVDSQSETPGPLRYFAIEVLRGKWRRPTKRGVERKRTWLRDAFLYSHIVYAARIFNLPVTRNDATAAQTSACDAVAEAMT